MHSVRLDTRVWEQIQELLTNEELMTEMLRNHEQLRAAEREHEDADLASLHNSEQSLKSEENRLLDAYGKGVIDLNQLQERMVIIKKQKEALQKVRGELNERIQQREVAKTQQATIKRVVALAKFGLHLLTFYDKRAFLESMNFRGIVDGEADKLFISGLIGHLAMSLSSKPLEHDDLRTQNERAVQRLTQASCAQLPAALEVGLQHNVVDSRI